MRFTASSSILALILVFTSASSQAEEDQIDEEKFEYPYLYYNNKRFDVRTLKTFEDKTSKQDYAVFEFEEVERKDDGIFSFESVYLNVGYAMISATSKVNGNSKASSNSGIVLEFGKDFAYRFGLVLGNKISSIYSFGGGTSIAITDDDQVVAEELVASKVSYLTKLGKIITERQMAYILIGVQLNISSDITVQSKDNEKYQAGNDFSSSSIVTAQTGLGYKYLLTDQFGLEAEYLVGANNIIPVEYNELSTEQGVQVENRKEVKISRSLNTLSLIMSYSF